MFCRDWKKLTFYYFADSYINFNSLVTDLFKIYKTRIWMSAINPASFASPTLGLQAPSGIGPGAVGVGRGSSGTERRQNQQQEQPPSFPLANQITRTAQQPSYPQLYAGDRPVVAPSAFPAQNFPYNPYGAFGNVARPGGVSYGPGMPNLEAYPTGFPTGAANRFPAPQAGGAPHDTGVSPMTAQPEWIGALQGLSLNSR
jgi:hypothetical protein